MRTLSTTSVSCMLMIRQEDLSVRMCLTAAKSASMTPSTDKKKKKTCVITVAVTTSIFFILADDITGIGVVDDIAIIPLIYIFEVLEEIS